MPDTPQRQIACVEHIGAMAAEIGDLDLRRNLKMRTFMGFVLAPVFRELQPRLRYTEMGRRGITPMQYYDDFESFPAPHGYGDDFEGRYQLRLCRSVSEGSGPGAAPIERLIVETRATLTGRAASGPPAALGYQPALGGPAVAGTGRVLHVLTRPLAPPGRRWVHEIPQELAMLELQPLDGPFPTIEGLRSLEPGFAALDAGCVQLGGIWGVANSDVYQHVHAREYIAAMENGITAALAGAGLAVGDYAATRGRIIFRRPSFVGQRYVLDIRLHRRHAEIVALGAFREADEAADAGRPAVLLRFDGRLV